MEDSKQMKVKIALVSHFKNLFFSLENKMESGSIKWKKKNVR